MRILTVVGELTKGGTERAAQNFAEAYQALGHDSRVLATRIGGVRQAELVGRGVCVWIGMHPETVAAVRDWQPDIVHVHSHGPQPADMEAILASCPSAAVIETNVFSRPSPWIDAVDVSFQLSTWCRWLYAQRAGAAASSANVPYAVKVGGFRRAEESDIARFRSEHGIAAREIVIGRVGQSHESKWSPLLVDALERLCDLGIPARLVVVNAPPGIVARCEASPRAAAVVAIDQVIGDESLCTVYSAMDIFAHVADGGESFGLVLAESMLCETPVVTLSTPWNDNSQGEVVGHEVGGIVATTPSGFLDAVVTLARNPVRRRQLGQQGRERVLTRYDSVALGRVAIDHALCTHGRESDSVPDRRTILSVYRDACDRPSWLTNLAIGRFTRLELTRYTTGYEPWTRFAARLVEFMGRRCGLVRRE